MRVSSSLCASSSRPLLPRRSATTAGELFADRALPRGTKLRMRISDYNCGLLDLQIPSLAQRRPAASEPIYDELE